MSNASLCKKFELLIGLFYIAINTVPNIADYALIFSKKKLQLGTIIFAREGRGLGVTGKTRKLSFPIK